MGRRGLISVYSHVTSAAHIGEVNTSDRDAQRMNSCTVQQGSEAANGPTPLAMHAGILMVGLSQAYH